MKIHRIDIDTYLNKYVYRIFPMERFIDVLDENCLTLARPKLWKDPMETILFEANLSGKENFHQENFYGQCWTLNYESEALWSIFAPSKNGVRVKTKLKTLITDLEKSNLITEDDWCVFGEVAYKGLSVIKEWFQNNKSYHDFLDTYKKPFTEIISLLVKRNQYKHENEIRLLYYKSHVSKKQDLIKLKINPLETFELIMLDPNMPDQIYEIFRKAISNYGFPLRRIIRSHLYDEKYLKEKLKK